MKLSELMRQAATTDPDDARDVIGDFQDYVERNQFGLIKLGGGPMRREVRLLIRKLEAVSSILEMAEAHEPLEET